MISKIPYSHPSTFLLAALLMLTCPAMAQESANNPPAEDDDVVILNPFIVQSSNTGYHETNAVSGTSLNMKIRDIAMSLEAINSEFIEDQQATDIKEALAYSAGVFTRSFADGSGANLSGSAERSPSTVASVNNPFTNTVSIRGFAVPTQQRFGFRIGGVAVGENFQTVLGGLTDTVNTDRLEVVRGPAALLYGVNVLSGVVNILPRYPLSREAGSVALTVGSDGFVRAQTDATGPLVKDRLNFRLMSAQEWRDHYTMFRSERKEYYAGQLDWKLAPKTSLLLEAQYGNFRREGTGAQFFSDTLVGATIADNPVNAFDFRNQYFERVQFGREDYSDLFTVDAEDPTDVYYLPKTKLYPEGTNPLPVVGDDYRVTGPDTFFEREEFNLMALLTLQPIENLNIELGGYYTHADQLERTVQTQVFTNRERDLLGNPNDDLPLPFRRRTPSSEMLWIRNPEVYELIGGYATPPPAASSYGLDEAVGFVVTPQSIPNLATGFDRLTSAGLGEVFVVPHTQRRAADPSTDWNTFNTKFARYFWMERPTTSETLQLRGRASYSFETDFPLLGEKAIKHTIIAGYQYSQDELSIVSGTPAIEDIVTPGQLETLPAGVPDVGLGRLDTDPYILRRSVFDLTPIRYNGEAMAIPGTLSTSVARVGAPLANYVEDGISEPGEITGWNIARSGWRDVTIEQTGFYGIYQAQLFGDRATFYAGLRRDSYQVEESEQIRVLAGVPNIDPNRTSTLTDLYFGSQSFSTTPYLIGDGSQPYTQDRWIAELPEALNLEIQREMDLLREGIGPGGTRRELFESTQRFTTGSLGLSVRVSEPLSIYMMYSEGVFPNQGQRDALDNPVPAEQTTNHEIGIKFDLFEGRVSGTISVYEIVRENATWQFNSAPSPRKWMGGALGPNPDVDLNDVVFSAFDAQSALTGDGPEANRITSFFGVDPDDYQRFSYGVHEDFFLAAWNKAAEEQGLSAPPPDINSGILANAGFTFVQTTDMGVGGQFENAGLNEPYYWVDVQKDLQPGVHITPDGIDLGLVVKEAFDQALQAKDFDGKSIFYLDNERTSALGAGNNPSNTTGDLVTFSDQTRGLDGQIFFTVTNNYQVIFSFSYQKREVIGNGLNLAPLIDPLTGQKITGTRYDEWVFVLGEENFTDPTDPTTFTGAGVNGLDLSFVPEINGSLWNKYTFREGPLDGLEIGFGVRYFGEAPTSVPIGGATLVANRFPTPPTKERYTLDASLGYRWEMWGYRWRLALKIDNFLDERRVERQVTYENPFDDRGPQTRRTVTLLPPRSFRLALSASF